jgi:hypothetical protein
MLEFVRFVFSSFWVWLGFVIVIYAIGSVATEIARVFVSGIKVKREITK